MLRSRLLYVVAVMFVCPSLLLAAKVKVWHQHTPAQYDKAQLKQMVLSNDGHAAACRGSSGRWPAWTPRTSGTWSRTATATCSSPPATKGKIYKVPAEGKPVVVYASEQSQVLCLVAASDGSIYAGTGPNGQIVRIDPRGQGKVFCETGEAYVWSLAVDPKGRRIYAGTGPRAKSIASRGGQGRRVLRDAAGAYPVPGRRAATA